MSDAPEADDATRTMRQAQVALRRHLPDYDIQSIVKLGEGGKNVAFEVNGALVVRVSKAADRAERPALIRREAALLAAVAAISTLPVPALAFADAAAGILAYRKVPGVPLLGRLVARPERLAAALGAFLSRLHAAPVEALAQVAPLDDATLAVWHEDAADDYREIAAQVPASARASIEAFLSSALPPEPTAATFCHNDLGAEHILVDPPTETVTGIIDWSDAAITDPMHDLGRLYRDFGPAFVDLLLRCYTGRRDAADRDRIVFYARCTLIEDIAFGLRTGASQYADLALEHLARTFA